MSVLLKLSTSLRSCVEGYDPFKGMEYPWREGLTVGKIVDDLKLPIGDIKVVMINGRASKLDDPVADGDRIGLFPPVGGG